jgi:hypothetical protein
MVAHAVAQKPTRVTAGTAGPTAALEIENLLCHADPWPARTRAYRAVGPAALEIENLLCHADPWPAAPVARGGAAQ